MQRHSKKGGTILKKLKKILFGRLFISALLILFQLTFHFLLLYTLSTYSNVIYSTMVIISLILVVVVVNDDIDSTFKLAWVIALLVLPFFGWALYLIFGHRNVSRSRRKKFTEAEEKHSHTDTAPTYYDENSDFSRQYTFLEKSASARAFEHTSTTFFSCGEDFFPSFLEALSSAEKFIYLEYFIIAPGKVWDSVFSILSEKASQGVDVRIMYDDLGTIALIPKNFDRTLEKHGIKSIAFNRLRPSLDAFMNHRDHRKIAVIDGKTAFTGGINLSDEYMNITSPHGYWKDYALRLDGDAVEAFTRMFLQLWEFTTGEITENLSERIFSHESEPDGVVIPFADNPINRRFSGKLACLNMISCAKKYIWITTPYLILDSDTVTALKLAARSGVDVRIITPHIPDKKYVFEVTRANYPVLIDSGVKIYEFTEGFVHAKSIICDDDTAIVGTMNFDFRSFYLHFENGVFLYRSKAIRKLKKDNENIFETATEITRDTIATTPKYVKLFRSFLKLFSSFL